MKIIIDSYIPYIKGALDAFADVEYIPHQQITNGKVRNADALIVRTRTQCGEALLKNSRVKFIASATIGYDHIDAEYCRKNGIAWTNAPGCNAVSVAQYMASVLSFLQLRKNFDLPKAVIGVVGVGAVGSKIASLARSFGMRVLLNDPPRERREKNGDFVSLDRICEESDIITFHTLLNASGEDKTLHLADESFFNRLKRKPVIVNAARGEIVSTKALLKAVDNGKVGEAILDCWENEPDINLELLAKATLATPHIAGYSADGKANAATQSVQATSRFFGLGIDDWRVESLPEVFQLAFEKDLSFPQFFINTYNVEADSALLKSTPSGFEQQRSNYPFRREPKAYLNRMEAGFSKQIKKQFEVFF
ncbi:MAG: 4-phosphoerythronate dehydrogenase [Prevotellaceae bacterium]|jgi:erythronate-4-phosphate dehydrogenase|nr:4-phosphoerythronate dehydrogenase [Prevotellaceae bacterium]